MNILHRSRSRLKRIRYGKFLFLLLVCIGAIGQFGKVPVVGTAENPASTVKAFFEQYCFQCHGGGSAKAGIDLEQMARGSIENHFQSWEKVARALEQKSMPPKAMPQPSDAERKGAIAWIRAEIKTYAAKHDGEPGPVTVRRLTSGEYAYAIKDLTGLDLEVGIDAATDSVGGEGFTNFGDVQFMQDANLERYLAAAKKIAEHAVIGSGPLEFFSDPGKTGFELSAIARIREIYAEHGFRTVSGEGGRPFGLEKYSKAFYTAWRFKHRAALGEKSVTLAAIAGREGINPRFAEHIYRVVQPGPSAMPGYPVSEVISRWRKLPSPGAAVNDAALRKACEEIQKFIVTWPSWLFARGDLAAGGAGDESPLEFSDRTLNVKSPHRLIYVRGGGRFAAPSGPAKIYLNVQPANPSMSEKPLVIWRNLSIAYRPIIRRTAAKAGESVVASAEELAFIAALRKGILPPGARTPLRDVLGPAMSASLKFGVAPDGTEMGPNDFASAGSTMIEIPMPEGKEPMTLNLQVEAEIGKDRDQVARITISDRPDGQTRGMPTRALIGDMGSTGYKAYRKGVDAYAALLPPNSHGEPTPADRDPIPEPFDNEYNTPEHDEFVQKIKYIRDDKFFAENLIDAKMRARLDDAWNDLFASFEYHNLYLRMLGRHYGIDLDKADISQMDKARIEAFPAEMQKYVRPLRAHYDGVMAARAAGRARHLNNCLEFASLAWRRQLSQSEQQALRVFYQRTMSAEADHSRAIRAVIARILVAPLFLYRIEAASNDAPARGAIPARYAPGDKSLTGWEMASRLSFFLWSSIPDAELRRAAGAGELIEPAGIRKQVKRMLADPKARRLSTEFFGQWLGFYHFDQYRGIDTTRFPEFTDAVKQSMYDEAVSFFEYIVRGDRPVRELWEADYTFLNRTLAKFYGVDRPIASADQSERIAGADAFHRGGMLRLGAVLSVTSAPLRTSPVKRGDWILRRIIGTPVPPPPADAGSIPADDKQFGGLTLKQKLEQHKRNASCANCHTRIDPLGFSLERFDPTGRWRDKYADGKPIEDSATLADKTELNGVEGLLKYLQAKDGDVRKNLSQKLIGYALGRTVLASDLALVDRMTQTGSDAPFSRLITEIAISKQFRTRMENEAAPRAKTGVAMKVD